MSLRGCVFNNMPLKHCILNRKQRKKKKMQRCKTRSSALHAEEEEEEWLDVEARRERGGLAGRQTRALAGADDRGGPGAPGDARDGVQRADVFRRLGLEGSLSSSYVFNKMPLKSLYTLEWTSTLHVCPRIAAVFSYRRLPLRVLLLQGSEFRGLATILCFL